MASQSDRGVESYTIAGVRYEIPTAIAEMLKSSKSHLQITIFNPTSIRFADYCAGVWGIRKKDVVDFSGFIRTKESVVVLEEVKTGGCACVSGFMEGVEEEVEIVETEVVIPYGAKVALEGVVDSDDTNILFANSEEQEETAMADESSTGAEISAANKVLKNLVAMGKIAQFDRSGEPEDDDCEIVQPSDTVSKRKKKELPMRIQPTRETGKRKQIVKGELVVAKSVKRLKRSKSGREILQEVECCEEFLMKEGLSEILELLEVQGWKKLCETMDFVCPEVVEDFYKDLKMSDGPVPTLAVNFRGKKFTVSSTQLAKILGLKHEGFDYYCKTSVWPKDIADKKQLVKEICQLELAQKGSGLSTQFMEPTVKILHKILVSNFMQRGVKPSYVQHQDLLLLDKLLKKEQINLPKLMVYQIDHLKNLSQIGYSRVIKRVLQEHKLYEVSSGNEEQVVKDFDPDVFRKMNLVKDQVEGWVKDPAKEPRKKPIPVLQEVEEVSESEDEAEDDNSKLMKVFERVISDLKSELREFKREVKEAIEEMKDELKALVEKF